MRSRSLPTLRSEIWTSEENFVAGGERQRRCSIRSKVRRLPDAIRQVPCVGDIDYDSDEEDRRNGVPITFSERRGCALDPSLIEKISQNLEESLEEKRCLMELLSVTKRRYLKVCNWFSDGPGFHWNASTRHYAFALEDRYYQLTNEKNQLDSEISHLETMLISFESHSYLPKGSTTQYNSNGTGWLWSSSNDYDKLLADEMFPLEFDGKDYNM
ncbi:hypothetical protein Hte_009330 [Hypoxylon texense]